MGALEISDSRRKRGTPRTLKGRRFGRMGATIMRTASIGVLLTLILAPGVPPARGAQPPGPGATCPISYGGADSSKPNKLYLYFPTSVDPNYPQFNGNGYPNASPAQVFDTTQLTNYTGTTAELRDAITNVVKATYCEFNVLVVQTTTAPPATVPRRNTVAIGTDADPSGLQIAGTSQGTDANDATLINYARVWAGTYQALDEYSGLNGALYGPSNSTTTRWANTIGGTVAHEAGHGYGLSHTDGNPSPPIPGEDVLQHHLMASGENYGPEDRAGYRRHFSNTEYSILAGNVGLAIQTMWNWDLVNPNEQTGYGLRMEFLSTQPSLIQSWSYAGPFSPWINPTVTGPSGTMYFKNTLYNKYSIAWSAAQDWVGGTAGQVAGGGVFHVGATFSSINFADPDAIIITNVELLDSANNPLALHPRLVGYDAGTVDSANDRLNVRFFNINRAARIIIRDVIVRELPRVMSLNAMVPGGAMVDPSGHPFRPWPGSTRVALRASPILRPGADLSVGVARLSQRPHVVSVIDSRTCGNQDRLRGREFVRCRPGTSTDLFPAATLFLTATVVDTSARFWDRRNKRYVVGNLESHLFYQIAGRRRARR